MTAHSSLPPPPSAPAERPPQFMAGVQKMFLGGTIAVIGVVLWFMVLAMTAPAPWVTFLPKITVFIGVALFGRGYIQATFAPGAVYRCGSLTYTNRTLGMLFFWLLWGDFCYVLMESVTGPIMTLKFSKLGASNQIMGLLLASVPQTLGAFLNPVISFKSDRFRSTWGRRIPFILGSLPFLTLALVFLGLGDHIAAMLHAAFFSASDQNQVTLYTFAVLLVFFTFFNTFLNSVYWYLFNDVVPEPLLSRFMSFFRITSMGAAALYNLFILPMSETHVREIFLGAAVLYGVGFTLMCVFMREGVYPAPPPIPATIPVNTPAFVPNKLGAALMAWAVAGAAAMVVVSLRSIHGVPEFPAPYTVPLLIAAILALVHVYKGDRLGTTITSWFFIGLAVYGLVMETAANDPALKWPWLGVAVGIGLANLILSHRGGTGSRGMIGTYGAECHILPHYWFLWAGTFIGSIGGGIGVFGLLFQTKALGLSLDQIGHINFYTQILMGVLVIGSGWLADRFHPIRVVLVAGFLNLFIFLPATMCWLWLIPTTADAVPSGEVFVISLVLALAINAPISALNAVWDPPLLMRLFPRSRYGQFCATNNLWRTMGGVLGAPLAGVFIDHMAQQPGIGEVRAYLYIPVWQIAFAIPSLALLYMLFRSWKRYGADADYVPPIDEPPPSPVAIEVSGSEAQPSRRWHAT